MEETNKHHFLNFYIAFLTLLLSSSSVIFAQQKEVKKDSLKLKEGVSGLVKYEYDASAGEDVYDGNFSFQSITPSSLKSFDYEAIAYEGKFASNQKSGNWNYSDKKIKEENQMFVSDFKIGKLATGTENRISGEFLKGNAVGNWQVIKQNFINSKVKDTLIFIESTFKNNKLVGFLKSISKSITVQGYFNADGYFHGDWEIEHLSDKKTVREVRKYEGGILKTYEIIVDGKSFDVSYSGLDASKSEDENGWQDYSLKDYFDILNLVDLDTKQSVSTSTGVALNDYHQKANQFIKNSVLGFSHDSKFEVWNSIRGSSPLELGKFKVRRFELNSNEKKQIKEIAENFEVIKNVLNEFLENPKIKIGKPAYKKFNKAELIFNIYRNELAQLKNMVDVISSDAFEFVDRDKIYSKIWPKFRFPTEITYEFKSELISEYYEFPKNPEQVSFDLDKANNLIENIKNDILNIQEGVEKIFKEMEVEKSLSNDEERLVEKKDKIESLFNSNSEDGNFNKFHKRYSELVLKLTSETFNTYGSLKIDEKKNRIKSLLYCYDNLIEFYIFLKNLESKNKRLDDAYTKITFNPYMMVDMSERIKENIYKAFDENLRPYLFNRLSTNFSCETIENAMKDIDNVYQKMLELNKRDTKQEEKELRREKDPEAILSVLEVELNY